MLKTSRSYCSRSRCPLDLLMRETGIRSQAAPWASRRLRNALVVCGLTVRYCVTPGNGATPPVGARRNAAEARTLVEVLPPNCFINSAAVS